MSILIKGMKMPKTCVECDFCHWSNLHQTGMCGRCNDEPVCADFGTDYKKTRARFCPLVEVKTPHGRLADTDVLKKRLTALVYGEANLNYCIADYIDTAATVIEAEEE